MLCRKKCWLNLVVTARQRSLAVKSPPNSWATSSVHWISCRSPARCQETLLLLRLRVPLYNARMVWLALLHSNRYLTSRRRLRPVSCGWFWLGLLSVLGVASWAKNVPDRNGVLALEMRFIWVIWAAIIPPLSNKNICLKFIVEIPWIFSRSILILPFWFKVYMAIAPGCNKSLRKNHQKKPERRSRKVAFFLYMEKRLHGGMGVKAGILWHFSWWRSTLRSPPDLV